jgi:hypothetical protein
MESSVTALALGPRWVLGLWTLSALAGPARAHDFSVTIASVSFPAADSFRVDLICDLDALALGLPPGGTTGRDHQRLWSLSPTEQARIEQGLRDTLGRRVRVRFDDVPADYEISFLRDTPDSALPDDGPLFFGATARLTGRVPAGAERWSFWASRAFGLVSLAVSDDKGAMILARTLKPGDESEAFPLGIRRDTRHPISLAFDYLWLGFEHILPKGLDHILFVLGLYFLAPAVRPLLWQVTAFTVAHSVTLALSMYEAASLSPRIVEPLIALSIVYVALENTMTRKLTPWRPFVVFAFGLLHGLGFAGVLQELGLPAGNRVTALAAFNIGVELGQLTVILLAFLVTGWWRQRIWFRARVLVPASVLIALVGAYWAIERVFA